MSVDDAVGDVLARLSDAQVKSLAAACCGRQTPSARLAQVAAGASPGAHDAITALTTAWKSEPSLTGDGVALALRIGRRARRDADGRRSRPVWTGPGAVGDQRLTAAVLHELVAHAQKRVLLMSYAVYTLDELADDLEAAVERGCRVDVIFETSEDSKGQYKGPKALPFAYASGITRWRWPAANREGAGLMHAKLLVVDGARALVGSANLSKNALSHSVEAGVLINDPIVAESFESHVHRLMAAGTLVRAEKTP